MTENRKEKVLPSWLCIILFLIVMVIVSGVLSLVISIFAGFEHLKAGHTSMIMDIINEVSMLVSILCAVPLLLHFGENKKMNVLGLSFEGRVGDLFLGFLVAALIMGGGFYLLISTGDIKIKKIHFNESVFLLNIIFFLLVAFAEEIAFRGYILGRLLRTKMNKYIALIISSLLFMLAHAPNNYTATLPLFNIFLAGLLLGSVYIYTKNLWYSISLHFFWNFLQGPVLGYSVSGTDIHSSIIRIKHSANTLLNGGNFGFEGSILCSVFMILFVLLTIWIMNNKAQNKELNSKVNTSVTEQMNE